MSQFESAVTKRFLLLLLPASKELTRKPSAGVTPGRGNNKSEGDGDVKRWDAYKEEVGEPGKQMTSPAYKFLLRIG